MAHDSEIGAYFKDFKDFFRDKRNLRYEREKQNLVRSGLSFEEKLNGQFVISTALGLVDYWATTGSFFYRESKKRGKTSIRKILSFHETKVKKMTASKR